MYEIERTNLQYYKKLLEIICNISKEHTIHNIIDIGGWHGHFINKTCPKDKYCFDLKVNSENVCAGVIPIQGDFLKYDFGDTKYDIVCCCQVLEHIDSDNVARFATKLFELSNIVIISVPYKWSENFCKWHKQDPVDEKKIFDWVGRKPNESYIVTEKNGVQRIINVYVVTFTTFRKSCAK